LLPIQQLKTHAAQSSTPRTIATTHGSPCKDYVAITTCLVLLIMDEQCAWAADIAVLCPDDLLLIANDVIFSLL